MYIKEKLFKFALLDNKVLVILKPIFYLNHNSNRIYVEKKIVIATV